MATTASARPADKRAKQQDETIADFSRTEVLAPPYTVHDMAPFSGDMG